MSMMKDTPNKGKGGRKKTFSDSLKVQVALEYLDGDHSSSQVGLKYNVSEDTVRWFVSWYRKNHQPVMTEQPEEEEEEGSALSPKELKAWEKKLALAELKIAVLEKVIAIANEEYGTDLKKKAATK
jgi:transposase-like protein